MIAEFGNNPDLAWHVTRSGVTPTLHLVLDENLPRWITAVEDRALHPFGMGAAAGIFGMSK